jgi:hypothetical protein
MMTFSINIGTSTEATNYNIMGATAVDFTSVLDVLQDNINKEINPKDIRDAILTSWSSSSFKQTTASQSTVSYIGIDNANTDYSNKDVKEKIYIGKRYYTGTNSNIDVMTSALLNSDADIFFYNTKKDTVSNNRTRIAILAGTNSSLFPNSPYIQSQIVTVGTYSSLSLDITNPTLTGGTATTINLNSDYGTVSINNISFPTIQHGLTAASDGRVLSWDNGKLTWSDITFNASSFIGTTGSAINIYGTPVNVNGHPFEFTESEPCPIEIGDIKFGETFNSVSIVEMLRRIAYPYLSPLCSLSILPPYSSGYVEIGTSPLVKLSYTISKRSLPTQTTSLSYMIPGSYPAITSAGQSTVSGTVSGVVITPVTSATSSFTITVTDGTQSNSSTATLKGVYPYFYGFSALSIMTTAGLASLTKTIEPKGDKNIDIFGSGNLYFIYDSNYPVLSGIYDNNGNNIISSSFSSSLLTLSSPTGLWASKQFRVYQWNSVPLIGPPSVIYQFKY